MCRCWDLSVDSVFDPLRDRGSREGCLTSLSTFHRFPDINRGKKARQVSTRDFSSLDIRKGKNNMRDIFLI